MVVPANTTVVLPPLFDERPVVPAPPAPIVMVAVCPAVTLTVAIDAPPPPPPPPASPEPPPPPPSAYMVTLVTPVGTIHEPSDVIV